MNKSVFVLIILCSILLVGFDSRNNTQKGDEKMAKAAAKIKMSSPAFEHGEMMPAKYTCDGNDISPPLKWQNAPSETKSFAIISDDPDAPMGTWVHWVIWNIPADKQELAEDIPKAKELPDGSMQGLNSSKRIGYMGPCPPSGIHRYFFKLYALDTMLNLPGNITKEKLLSAMNGHIIGEGSIMAVYQRQ